LCVVSEPKPNPLPGFPSGFGDAFRTLHKLGHKRSEKRKTNRKRSADSDPIKIRVEHLQIIGKTEKLIHLFEEVIGKDDIKLCDGELDALVLFDKEDKDVPNTIAAPVGNEIVRSQRVHLLGYAKIGAHEWFCVPGEVHSVTKGSVLITCLSVPGLSGGAVVCDGTFKVIAYSGGAEEGSDQSPFGAYAYRLDYIELKTESKQKSQSSEEQEEVQNQVSTRQQKRQPKTPTTKSTKKRARNSEDVDADAQHRPKKKQKKGPCNHKKCYISKCKHQCCKRV